MLNFYGKVVLHSTSEVSLLDYQFMAACLLYKTMTCHYIAEFVLSVVFSNSVYSLQFFNSVLYHEETAHSAPATFSNSLHGYAP